MTEPTTPNSEPSSEQTNAASSTSITLWSPADEKAFAGETIAGDSVKTSSGFKRGRMKIAAIALISGGIGAVGGAVANEGVRAWLASGSSGATVSIALDVDQLKDAVAHMKTDLATLKTAADQVAKANTSQVGKIGDRLDRIEKAQAEPNAKIAKLSEALDKLRTQPAAAPAPETTGSIAEPKPEPKKPPVVQGWVLRDVQSGIALVQGPQGLFDVEPGDPLPGLMKVEAIRREAGRWVVVTNKGWIVAR